MKSSVRIICIALAATLAAAFIAPASPRAADKEAAKAENAVAAVAPATPEDHTAEKNVVTVAPHKALYSFKLVKIDSGTQLTNIAGQMFFELQDNCDAWTTDHRFDLQYDYAEQGSADITSEFNTWEAKDGSDLHFNYTRKANDQVVKQIRGTAHKDKDGKTTVDYHMPKDTQADLPLNTLYPVAHTMEVARQALMGKKFFTATVFDGSDEEGASLANAFIGKPVNAVAEIEPDPALDMDLLNGRAWRVRLAFFKTDSQDSQPEYEMTAILHQNGVISDVVIDYPNFTIHQELKAIEAMPMAEGCK